MRTHRLQVHNNFENSIRKQYEQLKITQHIRNTLGITKENIIRATTKQQQEQHNQKQHEHIVRKLDNNNNHTRNKKDNQAQQ